MSTESFPGDPYMEEAVRALAEERGLDPDKVLADAAELYDKTFGEPEKSAE